VKKGLVAQMDRTDLLHETDTVDDWIQQMSDLSWTVALDNDVTIGSQILLQEQGIRLYPNYICCMMQTILRKNLLPYEQSITTEDYYFDTEYNTDPEKFEVKEVLVNINIENVLL
jgi:hypothetical protein